jgi:hypothetical protein
MDMTSKRFDTRAKQLAAVVQWDAPHDDSRIIEAQRLRQGDFLGSSGDTLAPCVESASNGFANEGRGAL